MLKKEKKNAETGLNHPKYHISRAATFTKFGKRLHEFQ